MSFRVLIVADHVIVRKGMRAVIQNCQDMRVVAEAVNGPQAVELARNLAADVIVMDTAMSACDGTNVIREIVSDNAQARIVATSVGSDGCAAKELFAVGARGYVHGTDGGDELISAIKAVCAGRQYGVPDGPGTAAEAPAAQADDDRHSERRRLSEREIEVLRLLADGHTARTAAKTLHISARTVETHKRNVMTKLDLHNIAALTKYAIRNGLTNL